MEDQQHKEKALFNNDGNCKEINTSQMDQALIDVMVLDGRASETNTLNVQVGQGEASGASIASSCPFSTTRPIPPFLLKLHDMLSNEETKSFVDWSPTGTSFIIKNTHAFSANVLPMYFRHNNFQSFVTQLNSYGFKKNHWDKWEYRNEHFQKGGRHLLRNIKRRNHVHQTAHQPNFAMDLSLNISPGSSNDKEYNLLKIEVMKLKEKQQTLDEKLASLKFHITSILQEPTNTRELKMGADKETHVKGKRKLGEITMCSDNVAGSCGGASKANVNTESKRDIVLVGKKIEEHHPESAFISLEDLIGESECIEFMREFHDKTNYPKP